MRRQETGFTLIELVIVIVILGILAAVAVPQFVNTTSAAQGAAASGGKSAVGSGIATYTARNKAAPTGTALKVEISATSCSFNVVPMIQISSQGTEGVKVTTVAKTSPTGAACAMTVVGVSSAKYTATL